MGDHPEGATDRVQARLDQTCQGSAFQAQRRDARTAANRRHAFSGHWNPGQPRRQGEATGHLRLEIRRRVSAVVVRFRPYYPREWTRRNSASFRFYTRLCAAVGVEGATMTSMTREPPPCLPLGVSSTSLE